MKMNFDENRNKKNNILFHMYTIN